MIFAQALAFTLTLAAAPAGTEVVLDGLKSVAPAAWKEIPASGMRMKQFQVPKAAGDQFDAEIVVFFFGPGGGGGVQVNVDRWKKMFQAPEGKKADEGKIETATIGKVKATILDIRGTYLWKAAPMAPESEPRANHRMLAVVFESPNGPYFIRLVGPDKTVAQHKKDFDRWLRSFK